MQGAAYGDVGDNTYIEALSSGETRDVRVELEQVDSEALNLVHAAGE